MCTYALELPYITEGLQGIGGRLRKEMNYFQVEEVPLYGPKGKGQHLYVNLTKKGFTTRQVQRKLANLFCISSSGIGSAGRKDKNAIATQTFSLLVDKVDHDFTKRASKFIEKNIPVKVNWAKLHNKKLRAGHLKGNKFQIIISDLEFPLDEIKDRLELIIKVLRERGVPNFFGPQRFDVKGDNIRRGLEIIKGKRLCHDKWLRRLLVSSYLSYLCNLYLTRRLKIGYFDEIFKGDIAIKYSTGGKFLVEKEELEQPRYLLKEISFTAPIFGSKMWYAKGLPGKIEKEIFEKSGIKLEQLHKLKAWGTRRLGRLLVNIQYKIVRAGLMLKFFLPKGSYATIVTREIMKNYKKKIRARVIN